MAEAEEVITDVARHATVFARDLWQRHRGQDAPAVSLADVAARVDLFITSLFGTGYPIRTAQSPAPPTLLETLFGRGRMPRYRWPLPATDGESLWLPSELGETNRAAALSRYRTMALQQAMRAQRGSARVAADVREPLVGDVFLLLEAQAADVSLKKALPGLGAEVDASRRRALAARPPITDFPRHARPLESFLRALLENDPAVLAGVDTSTAAASLRSATAIARNLGGSSGQAARAGCLMRDWWTGQFRQPGEGGKVSIGRDPGAGPSDPVPERSARLARRPDLREAKREEDERGKDGTWMVQLDEPHQKAEDPMGLQRPTDRGDENAEELADMLTELPAARMLRTPGRPKEFLLSDDPPESRLELTAVRPDGGETGLDYPEWDWQAAAYRRPGARVRLLSPQSGQQSWVDRTLDDHRAMLRQIRRRFEMLRARRVVLRKQADGDEIDLEACIDALADLKAGSYMEEGLYRSCRPIERNMAIMLLIDVSGSTDAWVSSNRRIIDVEREALLLVGIALQELGEPYAIQAFSGEGANNVTVRAVKSFDETFDNDVALRISALEPERYTRAGAAIRHATAALMKRPADHRLLLVLSDGKPNDVDQYEGRYGVEDMHRAITEARLQGVFPFCLTIDRQAANYLPRIFGANQYALLQKPELLPTVLLDWMRRLVTARQA